MSKYDYLKELTNTKTYLTILMSFENFLEENDIYVYKNWDKGEIASGPYVEKYWVTVILKYDAKNAPDPYAIKKFRKKGCKIKYIPSKQKVRDKNFYNNDGELINNDLSPLSIINRDIPPHPGIIDDNHNNTNNDDGFIEKNIWLIKITIPRSYLEIESEIE